MNIVDIESELVQYIGEQLLNGDTAELDRATPLLEWGLINSMEMKQLVTFLERRFGVTLGARDVVAQNFRTVEAIAALVGGRAVDARG